MAQASGSERQEQIRQAVQGMVALSALQLRLAQNLASPMEVDAPAPPKRAKRPSKPRRR